MATLIEIEGFYIDTKEQFSADAAVGRWDGVSNDDHIFYWFDDFGTVVGEHPDFIITSYKNVRCEIVSLEEQKVLEQQEAAAKAVEFLEDNGFIEVIGVQPFGTKAQSNANKNSIFDIDVGF